MLLAGLFGIQVSACSYRLGPMQESAAAKEDQTGSIAPVKAVSRAPLVALPESDLALARAAAAEVLSRGEKDASQPWENPATGARGAITPIRSAYSQDGAVCRDFLASYVKGVQETWFQGDACRTEGNWKVRDFRPLRNS